MAEQMGMTCLSGDFGCTVQLLSPVPQRIQRILSLVFLAQDQAGLGRDQLYLMSEGGV